MSAVGGLPVTLDDLASRRVWTAWRTEVPEGRTKPTKVPYCGTARQARSNDARTWLTRDEAAAVAGALPQAIGPDGALVPGPKGTGLWLGGTDGGWGLGGIDYDSCIGPDGLAIWAADAVGAIGSYAEVSPSGNGAKQFFVFVAADLAGLRAALGLRPLGTGRKWARRGSEAHPPGIEVYLERRFFAVTGDGAGMPARLARVNGDTLRHVLTGPGGAVELLLGRSTVAVVGDGVVDEGRAAPLALVINPDIAKRLAAVRTIWWRLDALWDGDLDKGGLNKDRTRSTISFHLAGNLRLAGFGEAEVHALLVRHPLSASWMAEKGDPAGDGSGREWHNLWRNTGTFAALPGEGMGPILQPAGWEREREYPGNGSGVSGPAGAWLPPYSDAMLAARAMRDRGADMRHVAAWGRWLVWDEGRWKDDATLEAMRRIGATCIEAAGEAPKLANGILSAKTIRAVESLARADARVAATTEQWDQDPWLLNTPGGVVDLRTGRLRPADPADGMTKITAVAPDFEHSCGMWRAFLRKVTGGDGEMADYLSRVAGYCLTGITSEHALFFLHGDGGNGKGTFTNALSRTLGVDGYAQSAPLETFTASKGERHLTEIARLRGARLVTTSETEEGRAWAESRIKQLTGGDPISANFMRQDLFTFWPQFKLLISGNHKPRIRAVNEAMRRRMNLLPFTVKITQSEDDKEFGDKLKAEHGGILAWAVKGCLEWQRIGLQPPRVVTGATDDYMKAEDSRSSWLSEACRDARSERGGAVVETRAAELYMSWRAWAEKAGEYPGTQKDLVEWTRQAGFESGINTLCQKTIKGVRVLTFEETMLKPDKSKSFLTTITGGKQDT